MTEIVSPFQQFFDTSGRPLANGAIYIGDANLDAQTNPIAVYWDEALTIPAPQPIRTLNGYPVWNGAPARLYANVVDYSITVRNAQNRLMYSAPKSRADVVDFVTVKDFGAVGDGITDDTAAIQAAYNSVTGAGLTIYWPKGSYKTSAAIRVKSNTTTIFDGGAVMTPVALANFQIITMTSPITYDFGYALFINENFTTGNDDFNIQYYNARAIGTATGNHAWYGGTDWNGHFIDSRNVVGLRIQNCTSSDMADFCAVMNCTNVIVANNYAGGASNAAYDFWEGNRSVVIRDNYAVNCNTGVNWNAIDTLGTAQGESEAGGAFIADNCLIDGNTIIGLGGASAILVAPLNTQSFCTNVKITNNYIDLENFSGAGSPNAITVQRSENILIAGNTIRRVAAGSWPIIITYDAALVNAEYCTVVNNQIYECNFPAGAYIAAYGPNHLIANNSSFKSTAFAGIIVGDPSTVVTNNNMTGASFAPIVNQTQTGTPTVPCFSIVPDNTNKLFRFSYAPQSDSGFAAGVDYAVTATGTNLATAYQITKLFTFCSTVAAGTGVKLPPATTENIGKEFVILNQGANALTIYAQSGDTVSGGASISLASGSRVRVTSLVATAFFVTGA